MMDGRARTAILCAVQELIPGKAEGRPRCDPNEMLDFMCQFKTHSGQPFSRAHCSTSTLRRLRAACSHVRSSHGHGGTLRPQPPQHVQMASGSGILACILVPIDRADSAPAAIAATACCHLRRHLSKCGSPMDRADFAPGAISPPPADHPGRRRRTYPHSTGSPARSAPIPAGLSAQPARPGRTQSEVVAGAGACAPPCSSSGAPAAPADPAGRPAAPRSAPGAARCSPPPLHSWPVEAPPLGRVPLRWRLGSAAASA
jgi:hypothetical protein